jgi:hypothetical protein
MAKVAHRLRLDMTSNVQSVHLLQYEAVEFYVRPERPEGCRIEICVVIEVIKRAVGVGLSPKPCVDAVLN